MNASTTTPAQGLRLLCHAVRVLVLIGIALALTAPLWVWLAPHAEQVSIWQKASGLASNAQISSNPSTLLLATALIALPAAATLYGLWQVWRLFGAFAAGEALTVRAQGYLRRFAWALLATALLRPLVAAALSVVLTIGNPKGQRVLTIGIGSDHYLPIFIGAVLLAVAIVMSEAVRAVEENRGFV